MKNDNVNSERILTLAVPTYNRKDAIYSNTNRIYKSIENTNIDYLIIDNASTDGTFEALNECFGSAENVTIRKNKENLGFLGNIIEILAHCKTKYILISSDEDAFNLDEIPDLINFLELNEPNFVSCKILRNGKLYRGGKTKKINSFNIMESSTYISGLIFDCSDILPVLKYLRENSNNQIVCLYPQVILSIVALMRGGCYSYDRELTLEKFELDSLVVDANGGAYVALDSRIKQLKDFEIVLSDLKDMKLLSENFYKKVRGENLNRFFGIVRHSIINCCDTEVAIKFDEMASVFYLKEILRRPFSTFFLVIKYLLNRFS